MALTMTTGQLIEGIKLAQIITEEASPVTYNFDTAEEATYSPTIEAGVNKVKRNKNTILGRVKTADIVSGGEIVLKQSLMIAPVIALIDGGTYVDATKKYTAPVIGQAVTRKKFTLNLFTASLDSDGDVIEYVKFTFLHCEGTPVEYSFVDGEFFVPETKVLSTPATGESPYTWEIIEALPVA